MESSIRGLDFYRQSMNVLDAAGIPFLVGGAYALRAYARVVRDTKDFDLMMRQCDVDRALAALRAEGYRAHVAFPHWIAKAHQGEDFIDIIYNSGNGLCPVDDGWFEHARAGTIFGRNVRLCPPEEMIWQKAYIMERERFDGADIAHLLRECGDEIDWERLLWRFGERDHPLLRAHLMLFQFIYPGHSTVVPEWVMDRLAEFPNEEPTTATPVCNGTLLSRAQYLEDVERRGYADARLDPRHSISEEDLGVWTAAINASERSG